MRIKYLTFLAACVWAFIPLTQGQALVDESSPGAELKSVISEWVETQRQLARAQSRWRTEKATLEFDLSRMREELKYFKDSIESMKSNESASLNERDTLLEQKQGLERFERIWLERLPILEKRVLELSQRLPDPLKRKISPALKRLQGVRDPNSGINSRLQAIVAILGETDQFHHSVQIHDQIISINGAEEIQVKVIYIGLTQAYFVNEKGEQAGTGQPGATEWEWSSQPKLADRVQKMIRIQSGESAPAWVSMPLELNQNE